MRILVSLLASLTFCQAFAADPPQLTGESEASIVMIDGLSKSETWGAKTKNTYSFENADNISIFGKYLRTATQAAGAANKSETALNWEAGLRYERVLTKKLNGFIQHKAEADPYNGIFTQRDSTDLGAKYLITQSETTVFLTEIGVRHSTQIPDFVDSKGEAKNSTTAGRLYLEVSNKFNEATAGKIWIEHVPNFAESDFNYTKAEASLSVAMNSTLSLKTAYEIYHREVGPKKDTSTWTTALVARY